MYVGTRGVTMFQKTRWRMAGLAALMIGLPVVETAKAQSGLDIFFSSLRLAGSIFDVTGNS
jgi:hypothetical protein